MKFNRSQNSSRNPVREAQIWVERIRPQLRSGHHAVLGLGLGIHIEKLYKQANSPISVFCFNEDEIDFFHHKFPSVFSCVNIFCLKSPEIIFEKSFFKTWMKMGGDVLSFLPAWLGKKEEYTSLESHLRFTSRRSYEAWFSFVGGCSKEFRDLASSGEAKFFFENLGKEEQFEFSKEALVLRELIK